MSSRSDIVDDGPNTGQDDSVHHHAHVWRRRRKKNKHAENALINNVDRANAHRPITCITTENVLGSLVAYTEHWWDWVYVAVIVFHSHCDTRYRQFNHYKNHLSIYFCVCHSSADDNIMTHIALIYSTLLSWPCSSKFFSCHWFPEGWFR